jgi:hypothetical protein
MFGHSFFGASYYGPSYFGPSADGVVITPPVTGFTGLPWTDPTALVWNQPIPPRKKKKIAAIENPREQAAAIEHALEQEVKRIERQAEQALQRKQVQFFRTILDDVERAKAEGQAIEAHRRLLVAKTAELELNLERVRAHLAEIDDEEALIFIMMSMQ